MAFNNVPDTVCPEQTTELRIEIEPDDCVQYAGTAAQLQAEGLIPEGFEWPRGATHKQWDANGFEYWLRREKPKGHKGPMRSWLEVDNWFLRVREKSHDYRWRARRQLDRRAEALRAEYYRLTAAGAREWNAALRRYWTTQEDAAFQAFKAKVPGLIPPKRGRKLQAQTTGIPQLSA